MQDLRLAGIFYEQRGPLVFSASLHLVAIIGLALFALVKPDKKPEELTFQLVAGSAPTAAPQPTLEQLRYESEPMQMPKPEDIKLPDRPKPVEPPAPKVVPKEVVTENALIPIPEKTKPAPKAAEPKPAETKPMSLEEYEKQFGKIKTTNVPKAAPPPKKVDVKLSDVTRNLNVSVESRIGDIANSQGKATANEVEAWKAAFREAVRRNLESHPFAGQRLFAKVICDISANGHVSNVRIAQSSGDPVFDRKAVAAFRSIGIFQAPPDNLGFRGLSFNLYQE